MVLRHFIWHLRRWLMYGSIYPGPVWSRVLNFMGEHNMRMQVKMQGYQRLVGVLLLVGAVSVGVFPSAEAQETNPPGTSISVVLTVVNPPGPLATPAFYSGTGKYDCGNSSFDGSPNWAVSVECAAKGAYDYGTTTPVAGASLGNWRCAVGPVDPSSYSYKYTVTLTCAGMIGNFPKVGIISYLVAPGN